MSLCLFLWFITWMKRVQNAGKSPRSIASNRSRPLLSRSICHKTGRAGRIGREDFHYLAERAESGNFTQVRLFSGIDHRRRCDFTEAHAYAEDFEFRQVSDPMTIVDLMELPLGRRVRKSSQFYF